MTDLPLFFAHAIALEEEAASRYALIERSRPAAPARV